MSYNGFVYPVAEGEITAYRDFFWRNVAINRRDRGIGDPIVMYSWDEEHEQKVIQDAEDKLATFQATSDEELRAEYESDKRSYESHGEEYQEKNTEQIDRVRAMRDQIQAELDRGVPPALLEGVQWHLKMCNEAIEYNEKYDTYGRSPYSDFEDWKKVRLEMAQEAIPRAQKKYEERKKRCEETRAFLTAAMEHYGVPDHTPIKVKNSSEMW